MSWMVWRIHGGEVSEFEISPPLCGDFEIKEPMINMFICY